MHEHQICTDGPINSSTIRFYSFVDGVVPKYKDHNVKHLVTLNVDLSRIPTHRYYTRTGPDGEQHYDLHYQIRATFFSVHTEYALWFDGENMGSVEAEYV